VLQDKKKYTAEVVGHDPQTDVAVVKIEAKDLTAAPLPRQFHQLVNHATSGGSLAMLVRRGESAFYVALQAS
jgi:hypothetical protein